MACSLSYILTSLSGDCTNSNLGGFSIDITGTAPDYSIQWVNPALGTIVLGAGVTGYTATTLSAGTYSFNILDSCLPTMTSLPVNINISSGTCASIVGISNTTCNINNGSITGQTSNFYGVGTFSLYETTIGFISSGVSFSNFFIFDDLSPGIYYVIADDGGGCSGQSETTIIQPSTNINWGFYTVMDSGCANVDSGKIYITGLTGTSPFTYLWSNGETTDFITGLTAGSYSVLITDSLGCTLSQNTTITEVDPLGFGSFTAIPPTCFNNDGEVTLTITGGTGPYYYSASTGVINVSFNTFQTFYSIGGGPFSVEVTDAALCKITPSTTVITPNGFNIVSVITSNSNCGNSDGVISINITDGALPFTYTLTNSLGDSEVYTNNFRNWFFNNLASDTYTLTISDNGGCTYVNTYIINNSPLFVFTADTTGTTCNLNNGYVEITVSGGTPPYTYNIGSESITTPLSAYTFDNLLSGIYSLEITESTPRVICKQTSSFIIDPSNDVDFILSGTDANNGNDGTVSAYITSGEPPFNLLWSNNVNNQTGYYLYNLSAGTYSLQVTDNNGCVKNRQVTINGFDKVSSYQSFNICDSSFKNIGELVKKGPKEMLNEGYYDLTSGFTNCILNQAIFYIVVQIGEVTNISQLYVSYGLNDYPLDNEYFNSLVILIESFDQVSQVNIDPLNNGIQIITKCDEEYLIPADVSVDIVIEYNISCQSCDVTPTPTPTPTLTPTLTPTSTQILTPTPTPTPTETSTSTCDCTRYEVFKNGGNPLIEVINCDGDTQLIRPAGYGSVSDTIFVCSTVMPTSGDWTTLITNGSCCSEFVDCSGYTITNFDSVTLDIFYTDCQFGFMSYSLPVGDNITVCSYTTPYSTGLPNLSVINNGSCNPLTPTPTPTLTPAGGIVFAQLSNNFNNTGACGEPLTENIEINVALYGVINTGDVVYDPSFPSTFNGGDNNWHIILLDSPSITYDVQIDMFGEINSVALCP